MICNMQGQEVGQSAWVYGSAENPASVLSFSGLSGWMMITAGSGSHWQLLGIRCVLGAGAYGAGNVCHLEWQRLKHLDDREIQQLVSEEPTLGSFVLKSLTA